MGRIIPVTDFDDPALDIYARLSENQLVCREKPEDGLFIAESALVIERALNAGFAVSYTHLTMPTNREV